MEAVQTSVNMDEMLTREAVQLSIFQGLTQEQMALIEPLLEARSFPEGEVIFEQGDEAQYLYILIRGEVKVRYKAYDGPVINVSRVTPGGIFGWSAALGRARYTSGAVCVRDCDLLCTTGTDLYHLCNQYPETGMIVLERLAGVISEGINSIYGEIIAILRRGIDGNGDCLRSEDHP